MKSEIALLDANIPMYAAGREHPYKGSCVWVMTEIAEGRIQAAIDTEIIQEILYRYGAIKHPQVGISMAKRLLEIVPMIYPILPADARLAVGLFERYSAQKVQARDVLHAAVMLNNGLRDILSTDTHFDHIKGIRRLDPQALFAAAHS